MDNNLDDQNDPNISDSANEHPHLKVTPNIQLQFKLNPSSNWKPGFANYNCLDVSAENSINSKISLDDGPEMRNLSNLSPDDGMERHIRKRFRH